MLPSPSWGYKMPWVRLETLEEIVRLSWSLLLEWKFDDLTYSALSFCKPGKKKVWLEAWLTASKPHTLITQGLAMVTHLDVCVTSLLACTTRKGTFSPTPSMLKVLCKWHKVMSDPVFHINFMFHGSVPHWYITRSTLREDKHLRHPRNAKGLKISRQITQKSALCPIITSYAHP